MLSERLRVLYLHGFASGPASRKAIFFQHRLRALGFSVDIPDLAEGSFENLTISGQLRVIERLVRGERLILIGSSMGGYLAALYAARHPEVSRLILLAPAFQLFQLWLSQMPPDRLASWREIGTIPVFHYGFGKEMSLGYQLMEDASQFEPFPDFRQPTLIFHGDRDTVVPVQQSIKFLQTHPNAQLIRVESGHELTDVLDLVWRESEKFLLPDSGRI